MRPLTAETRRLACGKRRRILMLQQRGVVHHLDVEHADQLLAFGIGRHAGGAVLLAEDRERAVGQRIDVGHLGIADRELDEARSRCARPRTCRCRRSPSRCAWPARSGSTALRLRLAATGIRRRRRTSPRPDAAPEWPVLLRIHFDLSTLLIPVHTPHPSVSRLPRIQLFFVRPSAIRSLPSARVHASVAPSIGTLYSSRVDARRTPRW